MTQCNALQSFELFCQLPFKTYVWLPLQVNSLPRFDSLNGPQLTTLVDSIVLMGAGDNDIACEHFTVHSREIHHFEFFQGCGPFCFENKGVKGVFVSNAWRPMRHLHLLQKPVQTKIKFNRLVA